MLDIFVCEDNAAQRRTVVKFIQNTVMIEELDMQLALDTGDPYMLLEKIKASQNTGIYFLDIDLNSNMNGMKLAQQIRLHDPRGFIIFITAHSELSYMTFQYRVEAMDFVLKDNPAEVKVKLRECLLQAMAFLVNKNNIKEIDIKNRIIHFANGETCLMSTRMMKVL